MGGGVATLPALGTQSPITEEEDGEGLLSMVLKPLKPNQPALPMGLPTSQPHIPSPA